MVRVVVQSYPRINDPNDRFNGYLDESRLTPHPNTKITKINLKKYIKKAIKIANKKSSRVILDICREATKKEIESICRQKGRELFSYFKRYCGDPASTAFDLYEKHYKDVCKKQFHNNTLQKERMNSGWRYQYLARDCASNSGRFKSVSDIGATEADFNATINYNSSGKIPLSLYVSIKNRKNTMGGQDWPKAIEALENVAATDKNREGPYCCVFGIVMDKGLRLIKTQQKNKRPYSSNTEIWSADFFWPFFSNYQYEEIMQAVLEVLLETNKESLTEETDDYEIPWPLIETFGECCSEKGLIDDDGFFYDTRKLVSFFCN